MVSIPVILRPGPGMFIKQKGELEVGDRTECKGITELGGFTEYFALILWS